MKNLIRITEKNIHTLPENIIKQLHNLTFKNKGNMQSILHHHYHNKPYILFIATDHSTKKIVGWAMSTTPPSFKKQTTFYFFVHRKYRRQGIGTKLLNKCYNKLGSLFAKRFTHICPHDKISTAFFTKNNATESLKPKNSFDAYYKSIKK